MECLLFL